MEVRRHTSRAPFASPCFGYLKYFDKSGSKEAQASRGDVGSLPLYGGTFARSYSVSNKADSDVSLMFWWGRLIRGVAWRGGLRCLDPMPIQEKKLGANKAPTPVQKKGMFKGRARVACFLCTPLCMALSTPHTRCQHLNCLGGGWVCRGRGDTYSCPSTPTHRIPEGSAPVAERRAGH